MASRLLPLLMILLVAAGCGSQSLISHPEEVRKLHGDEIKEITFWNSYSDEETRLLEQEVIPLFEREHPGIRVKSIHFSNDKELKNTLEARASSSRGPDVVRMDILWIPEFSRKGLLQPLNGFPGFEEIRSRFRPDAMDIGLYRNNYYSLPLNIYTKASIFNRELLKRAGYSNPPGTMEEVLEIAKRHQYTIGLSGFEAKNTLPYIHSLGGTLTNGNFTKASGYLNGEGTVRAVEQLLRYYREKIIKISVVAGGIDNWAEVQNGNLFMIDDGPWFYSPYNETELGKALELTVPVPFPYAERPASIVNGENMVILKGSGLTNEAWAFLRWMAGKDAQLTMSKAGMIPTNIEAFHAMEEYRDSYSRIYKEAVDDAFRFPPVPNWSRINEVYTRYLHQIFMGEWSVKEGLDRAAAEIDVLLADSDD